MATLNGTPGNDTLTGTASADLLFGLAGNDSLLGLGGNDTLNGGIGIDTMIGGTGNDTYIVDNTSDTVTEAARSGVDTVVSSVSYTLGSSLDNLTLTGRSAINGTGNDLDNIITGNAANNILRGGNGNDTIVGRGGSDRIFGGLGDDTLRGNEGNDSLFGYIGTDQLFGGSGNDSLSGGGGRNILTGSTGNAVGEIDILTGGLDRDLFVLGDATTVFYDDRNSATAGRRDYALITDFRGDIFREIEDVIQLNGTREDYVLAASPQGLPSGTAIYRNKPNGEPDELIGIVQGSTNLSLNGNYFRFTEASAGEFNLADLNGNNGFVLNGINVGDRSGYSVSDAGDVNGDGFDDIIIGARYADPNGQYEAGESYVVFGKKGGFDASFDLSNLNGSNGFTINGIDAADNLGRSVSGAGDVNGDGFDDIIIGALYADPNGQYEAGESYVVFGKKGGFDASFDLSNLNGSNGFTINGIDAADNSGRSVSGAGDINGDGFDDIIIGARYADPNGQDRAGESYVVFGKASGFGASFDLSNLNGSNGFTINGIDADDISGRSVSGAGDLNGDGFNDLLIGAVFADPNGQSSAGESYVVFGKAGSFGTSFDLSNLNGSNGFVINGIDTYDYSSRSLNGAGDVNGDGFDDLLIGAFYADPNGQDRAGESYVVFGKASGFDASLDLSNLNGSNGFTINGINAYDESGFSVSDAGDVNGDGFNDILIGARYADPNGQSSAGESYVLFGKASGFDASFDLSNLNGSNGFVLNGIDEFDDSGWSVSGAGDVNGDSFDDLIIGAPFADPNGQDNAGESYLIFGRADFTAFVTGADTLEPFNQSLVGNTNNALMPSRQDSTFGSTTAADNIFLNQHNTELAGLLGGNDIT